jgi:putative transposase
LPHFYLEEGWLFITWHLKGSLPKALYPPPGKPSACKAFVWMDRYLDTTRNGPMFLRHPEVARLIVEVLKLGSEQSRYDLGAFVVMANHVHVLLRPQQKPGRVLQWLKGTTARQANQFLSRAGEPFWQRESYDHWARNDHEMNRIAAYIENNPVKAGLVAEASEYPWSSAKRRAD